MVRVLLSQTHSQEVCDTDDNETEVEDTVQTTTDHHHSSFVCSGIEVSVSHCRHRDECLPKTKTHRRVVHPICGVTEGFLCDTDGMTKEEYSHSQPDKGHGERTVSHETLDNKLVVHLEVEDLAYPVRSVGVVDRPGEDRPHEDVQLEDGEDLEQVVVDVCQTCLVVVYRGEAEPPTVDVCRDRVGDDHHDLYWQLHHEHCDQFSNQIRRSTETRESVEEDLPDDAEDHHDASQHRHQVQQHSRDCCEGVVVVYACLEVVSVHVQCETGNPTDTEVEIYEQDVLDKHFCPESVPVGVVRVLLSRVVLECHRLDFFHRRVVRFR